MSERMTQTASACGRSLFYTVFPAVFTGAQPAESSVDHLVIEAESATRLGQEVLHHREVVAIDRVEDVVAVEADGVYRALLRETPPEAEVHHGVTCRGRVAHAQARLRRRHAPLDHSHPL